LDELIYRKSGISDDASERPLADLFVVGHDDTAVRFIATKNHVTAGLTTEHESGALQGCTNFGA
jgi:hypothetical protein